MDSLPKSFNPNKRLKEEFVSNLSGSSMLEIFSLSTTIPVLVLLRHSMPYYPTNKVSHKKNDDVVPGSTRFRSYMASMTIDFLVIVVPMLLFITVLSDWNYAWAILFTMLICLFIVLKRSTGSLPSPQAEPISLKAYITSYRVLMMIMTCLCILAVDFRIFPRRYAKTETYGSSLMDIGVGSFVLANALVSRQARNVSSTNWKTAIRYISPQIILGFIRLVTTRGVDYQVHVGEYGVHWNFFFTLAAISVLTSAVNIPPLFCGLLGSLVLAGYHFCLSFGLNLYLLSDKRGMDIISQNKEGIFSIFGYWGMYLIGVHLGNYVFFSTHSSSSKSSGWARIRVWVLSILFWLSTVLLDKHVERVSRRMCNLPYVTMILAANLQILAILMLADFIPGAGIKTSVLEEAYNQNLLATFLLANVLTGAVNLSVDTLSTSSLSAICILLAYACVLSTVIGTVNFYDIKLKFW